MTQISMIVTAKSKAIQSLLKKAKQANVILKTTDGDLFVLSYVAHVEGFYVGDSGDFEEEIKMTRKNKKLMKFLDARRAEATGKKRTRIEDVRRELGLA